MVRIGIVGLGYWGPNLARNFHNRSDSQVAILCDQSEKRLNHIASKYPDLRTSIDPDAVFDPKVVDAVVIATPSCTHYDLAKRAIEVGLHTFVEKPMAMSPNECMHLIELSEKRGVTLFVGHIFLYTAAVTKLRDLIDSGDLGDICYISASRLNLGPVRTDTSVLWDLASHDVSVILHLMDATPVSVNCQGISRLSDGIQDICSMTIYFDNNTMAIVQVSWLNPNKTRLMTIVGDRKMAVYNDVEPLEKIRIYDKGVEQPRYSESYGDFHFSYRYGDTLSPMLNEEEPLKKECAHFIECINTQTPPLTDGFNGLEVVMVLKAAEASLKRNGSPIEIEWTSSPALLDFPVAL